MVSLMQRRREMMQSAAVGPGPSLITFDDRNFTINSSTSPTSYVKVTNGNHFESFMRNRGTSYQSHSNLEVSAINANTTWEKILTIPAGSTAVMKLKNVDAQNRMSGSGTYTSYILVVLRDQAGANIFGFTGTTDTSPLWLTQGQTRTYDELTVPYTPDSDKDVTSVRIYTYGTAQAVRSYIEFDLELYVNGTRYI